MAQLNLLDYDAIEKKTGIKRTTLRVYLSQARTRREQGVFSAADFPEPDTQFGQSPAWLESTIDRWLEMRPGKGVGGGGYRPRRT